ncbi:MAG: hypothetical protein R6U40_03805 [Desulfobacterales bacterium]
MNKHKNEIVLMIEKLDPVLLARIQFALFLKYFKLERERPLIGG